MIAAGGNSDEDLRSLGLYEAPAPREALARCLAQLDRDPVADNEAAHRDPELAELLRREEEQLRAALAERASSEAAPGSRLRFPVICLSSFGASPWLCRDERPRGSQPAFAWGTRPVRPITGRRSLSPRSPDVSFIVTSVDAEAHFVRDYDGGVRDADEVERRRARMRRDLGVDVQ